MEYTGLAHDQPRRPVTAVPTVIETIVEVFILNSNRWVGTKSKELTSNYTIQSGRRKELLYNNSEKESARCGGDGDGFRRA